jgi:hypothetical protein
MGAAFFIQNPVVAIPCCVCEIVLLALVSALLLYRA